jgi:hypothetical protein
MQRLGESGVFMHEVRPIPIRRPWLPLPLDVAVVLAVVIAACVYVAGPGLAG